MTVAPPRLLEWRSHMQAWTGLAAVQLGIVGGPGHILTGTSYHLGKDQLIMSKNPYSARHPRDVAGLTNAASACDTGPFARLVELTAWAVAQALAGRRPDTRELIGPGGDGRAYRWAVETGWRAELRPDGDDHENHLHESFFRDSEHGDKVGFYRPFFEGDDMTPEQAKQLHDLHEMVFWNVRPWLEAFIHATDAQLAAIAERVDIDPAELEAIKAAASAGAQAGAAASVDAIAAAVIAHLPEGGASPAEVEAAIRRVLGGLDGATPGGTGS